MSPTLAAGDRTVIPIYAGIQVYYTSDREHTTRIMNEDERMNMILTFWPPIVWDFSKYKIMKNLARTLFPFLL